MALNNGVVVGGLLGGPLVTGGLGPGAGGGGGPFGMATIGCPCCGSASCVVTFHLTGCNGGDVQGITVNVKSGGSTIATGATDAGGLVTLDIGTAGTYTVEVPSSTGFDYSQSTALTCGSTYTIALSGHVATTHVCTSCAEYPVPKTLTLNDPYYGDVTITNSGGSIWIGSISVTTEPNAACSCPGGVTSTIRYSLELSFGACGQIDVGYPYDSNTCPDDAGGSPLADLCSPDAATGTYNPVNLTSTTVVDCGLPQGCALWPQGVTVTLTITP